MSGFDNLPGALTETSAEQINPQDVAFQGESLDDQTALNRVLSDVEYAEKYFSQYVQAAMEEAQRLYKGQVKQNKWANGKLRSALSMPVVLDATEKLVSKLHTTLWGGKRPFAVQPTGKTTPEAALAKERLLTWALREAGVEEEMRLMLKSCLLNGYCLGEWGWETVYLRKKVYKHDEQGNVTSKPEKIPITRPFFHTLDLHKTFIDPKLNVQDPRKGQFYVKQTFLTGYDLHDMQDDSTYKNIPTDAQLAEILAHKDEPTQDPLSGTEESPQELQARRQSEQTSSDPLAQPLSYMEYWTDDHVIGVLQAGQGGIPIRNEANEFGRKNCVGCAFIDVLNSAHGFGVGRLLSGEQALQTGTLNTWMDGEALVLNPVFQLLKGTGIGSQSIEISPGKVLTSTGELKQLEVKSSTVEAMGILQSSQDRAFKRVAANGGSNVMPQTLRTSEGVSSVQDEVTVRLQYFLNIFINLVLVPTLDAFLEMMCDKMQPKDINEILTLEQGKEFQGDVLDVYNSTCRVTIVAGSKLTSREAAAQLAPLILQFLQAAPVQDSMAVQNKKWNYFGFFNDIMDRLGWDAEAFVMDMTPQDQERYQQQQQSSAAAVKAQTAMALEQLRQQGALNLQDRKGDIKMADTMLRATTKGHSDAENAKLDSALSRQEANQQAEAALNEGQNNGQ